MVYVDPYKLLSRQLSPMDVVDAVNSYNLILPAGDVKVGVNDYYVYSNSLVNDMSELSEVPVRTVGTSWTSVGEVGKAQDANQIQYNVVRVDGQRSCYIPIMKQGGDTNTIEVVNGVRKLLGHLYDIPKQMVAKLVFDQSTYVKEAIHTVLHEGVMGLFLTSVMILLFLGSFRATSAVLLSIPLSALTTFVVLFLMGSTVNTMILGGLALAFSRVIDNSVISLENLSPSGNGRSAGHRGRGWGSGSKPGGTGRNPGGCCRFLPCHVPLRCQQVSFLIAGFGLLPLLVGVLRRGYDGHPAFLLAVSEAGTARCRRLRRRAPR
jgi:multidrug efflux pump subunit AcrB